MEYNVNLTELVKSHPAHASIHFSHALPYDGSERIMPDLQAEAN